MKEAQEWVRGSGPSLDEILTDRAYATARSLGKKRLLMSLEKERLWLQRYDTEPEAINELLSYIVARMIVSAVGDRYLIRRYALSEAERVNQRLQDEPLDLVMDICRELDISVGHGKRPGTGQEDGGTVKIHFIPFLRYTSQMRAIEWKLVNMRMKDGFVELDKRRVCRVVQEVLRRTYENDLPLPITDAIKEAFEAEILEVLDVLKEKKKFLEPYGVGKIMAEHFPPCIKRLLAMAQAGENLSHMGRFTLATFLNTLGMSGEEILKVFANSPDFREDLATYQIDHVTGRISGTVYTPPECTTMVSFGLCHEKDRLCEKEWLTHPLKYYRSQVRYSRRKKGSRKGSGKGPEKDEGGGEK
jgi:DNA primase large subunit